MASEQDFLSSNRRFGCAPRVPLLDIRKQVSLDRSQVVPVSVDRFRIVWLKNITWWCKFKLTALVLVLAPEWMVSRRDVWDANANRPAVRVESQPLNLVSTLWRFVEVKDVSQPISLSNRISMSSSAHIWISCPVRYCVLNLFRAGEVAQFDLKESRRYMNELVKLTEIPSLFTQIFDG